MTVLIAVIVVGWRARATVFHVSRVFNVSGNKQQQGLECRKLHRVRVRLMDKGVNGYNTMLQINLGILLCPGLIGTL